MLRQRTGLLVFNDNIENGVSDIGDVKRRIMLWPWNLGYGSHKVIEGH